MTHGCGADPADGGTAVSTPPLEPQVGAAFAVPSRVLVTGGGGRIGSAVVRRLLDLGCEVVALDRRFAEPSPATIAVTAAATDETTVAGALEGCDGVVHLAAFTAPRGGTRPRAVRGQCHGNLHGPVAGRRTRLPTRGGRVEHQRQRFDVQPPSALPVALSDLRDRAAAAVGPVLIEQGRGRVRRRGLRPPVGHVRGLPAAALHRARGGARRVEEGNRADPLRSVREGWSYLDVTMPPRRSRRALAPRDPGHLACLLAADDTLLPWPTEEALARWAPGVPLSRPLPGRSAAVDSGLARRELGFAPASPLPLKRPRPAGPTRPRPVAAECRPRTDAVRTRPDRGGRAHPSTSCTTMVCFWPGPTPIADTRAPDSSSNRRT